MSQASTTDGSVSTPARRAKLGRLIIVIAIIVSLIGGGAVLWRKVLRERIFPKRFGAVEAGWFYRSGQISPTLIKSTLVDCKVRVVVDLTGVVPDDPEQAAETRAVTELGISRYKFPLSGDGTGDIHRYADALAKVVEAKVKGEPVLVHCSAGTERTGALVTFYRVLIQGHSSQDAYYEMKSYGWSPRRNKAMIPYLNGHMAELAGLLVERGVLEKVPDPLPVVGP